MRGNVLQLNQQVYTTAFVKLSWMTPKNNDQNSYKGFVCVSNHKGLEKENVHLLLKKKMKLSSNNI